MPQNLAETAPLISESIPPISNQRERICCGLLKNRPNLVAGLFLVAREFRRYRDASKMDKLIKELDAIYQVKELKVRRMPHGFEVTTIAAEELLPTEKKYVIYVPGCGSYSYEFANVIQQNIAQFERATGQRNLISLALDFNLGISQTVEDLAQDIINLIEDLLREGVLPQNIILYTYSAGVQPGFLALNYYHQLNKPIRLFSVFGYRKFSNLLEAYLPFNPFWKWMLEQVGWQRAGENPEEIYRALVMRYREQDIRQYVDYVVIRDENQDEINPNLKDGIIPYSASLHAGIKVRKKTDEEDEEKEARRQENRRHKVVFDPPDEKSKRLLAHNAFFLYPDRIKNRDNKSLPELSAAFLAREELPFNRLNGQS